MEKAPPGLQYGIEKENIDESVFLRHLPAPRPEFAERKSKLDLSFKYSSGSVATVKEKEIGEVEITLSDESGSNLFNFKELLPPGYKFVTPRFLLSRPELAAKHKAKLGHFYHLSDGFILLGDITSARDMLSILHEVGHAFQKPAKRMDFEEFEKISKREREAWSYALGKIRDIKKNTNTDLLEVFQDYKDASAYIHASLFTYRNQTAFSRALSYGDDPYQDAFENELKGFFDKGKLPRIAPKQSA